MPQSYTDWHNFLRGSNTETLNLLREARKQLAEEYASKEAMAMNEIRDIDQEFERRKQLERTNRTEG